jgi:hypothetical protein
MQAVRGAAHKSKMAAARPRALIPCATPETALPVEGSKIDSRADDTSGFQPRRPELAHVKTHIRNLAQDKKRRTPGASQIRDVAGFSMVAGSLMKRAANNKLAENLAKRFPMATLIASAGLSSGKPKTYSSLRRRGGPFGRSRALGQEAQGVPKCSPATRRDSTQPRRRCWMSRRERS